jgi:transposase
MCAQKLSDKRLVSDSLWQLVEPMLPRRTGRARRLDDRAVLEGILYVLKNEIAWYELPRELGCGSGMTCWRRLREWYDSGVWDKLHVLLLTHLPKQKFNFSRINGGNESAASAPRVRRIRTSFLNGTASPAVNASRPAISARVQTYRLPASARAKVNTSSPVPISPFADA